MTTIKDTVCNVHVTYEVEDTNDWTKPIPHNPFGNRYLPIGRVDYRSDAIEGNRGLWLKVAQELSEIHLLRDAAKLVAGKSRELKLVDLGTHKGGSAINMARGSQRPSLLKAGYSTHVWTVEASKDLHEYAKKQMLKSFTNNQITPFHGTTIQFADVIRKGHMHPVDFVFIDADHSYEGVMNDWINFSPFVKPGGMVAFHDTNQAHTDEVIRELVNPKNWKLEYWVCRIKAFRKIR